MATDIAERSGNLVAERMAAAGITKQQLAEKSGIPYSTLGRRINGVQAFNLAELEAIARVLKISPTALLPEDFATTPGE